MFTDKAHRAIKFGAIYSVGFLVVMAALVIIFLPSLQLSRLAVVGLFFLSIALGGIGIFQGSCRVNRLTMPPFSRSVALDPGSTTRCRSVPSYASGL
ncbi:hypothetical protein, partial [Pseudomonas sp. MF6776]|uniref:hypothetical protein n=1 Tax=Pseudomonas sp. MF6776 TaxID=2797534 RepID=UPI001F4048C4